MVRELVLNANTVHRLAPVAQSHVRGVLNGLHLVEPHEDGCVYTMTSRMDPKGVIPMFIVNWFAMRRPLQYMVALRDLGPSARLPAPSGWRPPAPAVTAADGSGRLPAATPLGRRGARRGPRDEMLQLP